MNNPFSLKFGREPMSVIERSIQSETIIDAFSGEEPEEQVYMITGVRGCGKTVLLNMISDYFDDLENWTVIHLNPQIDMLDYWAAALASKRNLLDIFKEAKLNLSVFGMSIELDPSSSIKNSVVALEQMLTELTKKGKSVLITVDEASNTEYVRKLAAQFQIFMGRKFNVFLLMTGLYENIYELQKEKDLTFLYRARNMELSPLNELLIAQAYEDLLKVSGSEARKMASLTKGYSFAYQALGYYCFKNGTPWQDNLANFDAALEMNVYQKLWLELSPTDKKILTLMSEKKLHQTGEIRKFMQMLPNQFTVYRSRLIHKGILVSAGYGLLEFQLPRFQDFVRRQLFQEAE